MVPPPSSLPPRSAQVSRVTGSLGALPSKANTVSLEVPALGWEEWRVESRLKERHSMGRPRHNKVATKTGNREKGDSLKTQDVEDRGEREKKGR